MTGISLANQEDAARATQEASDADTVYARDYAAIVEAMRLDYQRVCRTMGMGSGAWLGERYSFLYRHHGDAMSYEQSALTFASQWGFPALLRALARAIELETGK